MFPASLRNASSRRCAALGGRARAGRGPGSDGRRCARDRRGRRRRGGGSAARPRRQPRRRSPAARPEAGIAGMSVGDAKDIEYALPEGETRIMRVTVKELKEPVLPPLDDELAKAASEFGPRRAACGHRTVPAAGRRGARGRLPGRGRRRIGGGVGRGSVRRARRGPGGQPYPGVRERAGTPRSRSRPTSRSARNPEQIQQRMVEDARRSLARELILEAVAERLAIEVSDDELRAFIREQAEFADEEDPDALVEEPWHSGRHETLRTDLQAACRARPCRERGQADLARACERTRKALDARAGEARRRCETVDPGEKEPADSRMSPE